MDRPEKWYTARAVWIDDFKKEPEALEWFLRTWRVLAYWLVEGRKQVFSTEETELFSALPASVEETPPEQVQGKVPIFMEMTDLLITWSDSTIRADSTALLRLVDHVWRLRWDRKGNTSKAFSRDWEDALHLFRRLWLQLEIRKRPTKRTGHNKHLEPIRRLLSDRVLDGPDLARELGALGLPVTKDNIHQIMHRLKPHGFGRVAPRGYGKLTDTQS